ncbi:O-methyltransferase VdtC [Cladobotryum mycophilum]|uniref:O-methyltransferase VdtC n=1 Tax=Cladobotryum mycophilum TaxID=491253 RepID=A0ABR0SI55_9HYPO
MASIEDLASTIKEQVSKLSALHQEIGTPLPTFEPSGFADYSTESNTPHGNALRDTRNQILDAALDLIRLVRGPTEHLLTLSWATADSSNLDLITRFNLPQHVPLDSTTTFEELSVATQIPAGYLARIVRYGIANGIFVETEPGVIGHSASSAALVKNQYLFNIVHFGLFLSNLMLKSPDFLQAQRDDPANAPKTPFQIAYRTEKDMFQFFHENTDVAKEYHEYLAGRVNTPLWSVDRLRTAWPWASKGEVTVVDVGGSVGHTVQALAPLMPEAKFIVQDNNTGSLEMGRQAVENDSDLKSRISFTEYDFFTPQPVQADVYIYRHIMHDWNDEDSTKILSSLLPALKPGARVLISEGTLPPPPATRLNTLASKMIRIEDSFMLGAHDARERSVADFESLFQQVKPGAFRLVGVTSGSQDGAFQSLLDFEFLG